jgi:hypothetical protein
MFKPFTKTFKNLSRYSPNTLDVIVLEKLLVAFFMPKGITVQ